MRVLQGTCLLRHFPSLWTTMLRRTQLLVVQTTRVPRQPYYTGVVLTGAYHTSFALNCLCSTVGMLTCCLPAGSCHEMIHGSGLPLSAAVTNPKPERTILHLCFTSHAHVFKIQALNPHTCMACLPACLQVPVVGRLLHGSGVSLSAAIQGPQPPGTSARHTRALHCPIHPSSFLGVTVPLLVSS